jgi:hypothetical protein
MNNINARSVSISDLLRSNGRELVDLSKVTRQMNSYFAKIVLFAILILVTQEFRSL